MYVISYFHRIHFSHWHVLPENMTKAPATKDPAIKAPEDKSPRRSCFSFNTLSFQNQVEIFPATLLQVSSSLRSRCNSNLKRGGSREVLVGSSESG